MDEQVLAERLNLRLPDALLARLAARAAENAATLSDLAREALERYCDEEGEGRTSHTPDECTRTVLSALPAELLTEIETKADQAGLTLGELVVAILATTSRNGWQEARAKRPQPDVMVWPPRAPEA